MQRNLLIASMFTLAAAAPSIASAAPYGYDGHNFVHSAVGPGEGYGTLSLGARAYFVGGEDFAAVPTVDLSYVYGMSDRVDWETRLATIGAVSLIDTGVRWRMLGSGELSLAARLDGSALVAFAGTHEGAAAGALAGVTPGVMLSAGSRVVQISAGIDVPMLLGAGSVRTIGGVSTMEGDEIFGYVLRPWIAAEVAVSKNVTLSAQAQAYMDKIERPNVLPALSIGVSW